MRAGLAGAAILAALICAAATGALLWQRSARGPHTPLAIAAHTGDAGATRALIAGGADPNERDARGNTALHWAARGGHRLGPHRCAAQSARHLETIKVLLAAGADPGAADSHGWTPARVARDHHQDGAVALLTLAGVQASADAAARAPGR